MEKIISIIMIIILTISSIGTIALSIENHSNSSPIFEYDMVIIAPNIFSDELQQLIEHKNIVGVKTFLQTTENIFNEYSGRDKAEQIKYFIKDSIESSGIKFVLLIGGRIGQSFQWFIPPRYSHTDDGFMHREFLSDLYYADIYNEEKEFEDWDSNGNNVFSEWYIDEPEVRDIIDLRPDVALGRLPCRNEKEVEIIVSKIIEYEQGTFGQSWFRNALLIGGDTNPGVGDPFPFEGEADCIYTAQLLDNFSVTTLFVSDGSLTGYDAVVSSLNRGYGFVLFHGHGLQDGLFTHTIEGEELAILHTNNVSELHNKGRYPIMIVGCCLTTEFDVGVLNFLQIIKNLKQHHYFRNYKYECVSDVLSWNLMKKKDGGTIAHIGDSSTAWGMDGDTNNDGIPDSVYDGLTTGLCAEFFRQIANKTSDNLGIVYQDTLISVLDSYNGSEHRLHCKNVQEFQLIGDPSLKIGGYPNLN